MGNCNENKGLKANNDELTSKSGVSDEENNKLKEELKRVEQQRDKAKQEATEEKEQKQK